VVPHPALPSIFSPAAHDLSVKARESLHLVVFWPSAWPPAPPCRPAGISTANAGRDGPSLGPRCDVQPRAGIQSSRLACMGLGESQEYEEGELTGAGPGQGKQAEVRGRGCPPLGNAGMT
jgi:hypothetical protein